MHFSVLANMISPIFYASFGISVYLIIFLTEFIVLRLLKWNTFWRSLLASLLMNLPSTLVGVLVILLTDPSVRRLGTWLFPTTWAISVAIEGGVLILMKHDGGRKNWVASLAANTSSYLLLLGMLQLL